MNRPTPTTNKTKYIKALLSYIDFLEKEAEQYHQTVHDKSNATQIALTKMEVAILSCDKKMGVVKGVLEDSEKTETEKLAELTFLFNNWLKK